MTTNACIEFTKRHMGMVERARVYVDNHPELAFTPSKHDKLNKLTAFVGWLDILKTQGGK